MFRALFVPATRPRHRLSPLRLLSLFGALRAQRRNLAQMDDHLLRDIGLTREQAHNEADRPFWDVPPHWRGQEEWACPIRLDGPDCPRKSTRTGIEKATFLLHRFPELSLEMNVPRPDIVRIRPVGFQPAAVGSTSEASHG